MSKLNTPLLSMEAHGTVGDAITYQGKGRVKLAREKPKLPYSLTLPQQYQRWLYEDYAYLWRQQSQATQAEYRSAGVRFHRTGFQQWMSVMLSTLPDIAGWWKMDIAETWSTPDSSKNNNKATVFGAIPCDGYIDRAYLLDGVNDYLLPVLGPTLTFSDSDPWTFEVLINWSGQVAKFFVWYAGWLNANEGFMLRQSNNNRLSFRDKNGVYWPAPANSTDAIIGVPSLVTFSTLGDTWLNYYIDDTLIHRQGGIPTQMHFQALGRGYFNSNYNYKGVLDNAIIYTRCLDQPTIARHSLRRYP